jgi:hypothetical protein
MWLYAGLQKGQECYRREINTRHVGLVRLLPLLNAFVLPQLLL